MRNFTRINAGGGLQRWLHKDGRTFVSHYPRCGSRPGVFYVLRAVAKVPAGRMPWTVDNRRLCSPRGSDGRFNSLPQALTFAEAA